MVSNMGNLKKDLTLTQVISMAAGGMIAAWMVEMIYWFELSGPGSFWALLTTGVLVIPLALIYSELTSMLPFAGGENIWISNAFNSDIGWYFSWMLFLLYIFAIPNVAYGLATMANYFYPLSFIQIKLVSLVILVFWFGVSFARVKIIGKLQNTIFWVMVLVATFVSLRFIISDEWSYSTLTPWFPEGVSGFGAAVGILVFKYIGFDLIPQLSEEAKFPRKSQWKAYLGAVLITFVVYGLAVIGNAGIVSVDWIVETDIVDPRVADLIGEHYLAILLVIVGILGTLTTLSGFWLAAARVLFSASRQNQLPKTFAKLNRSGQPKNANIIVAIFSIYFAIIAPDEWIQYMYTVYAFVAGSVYLFVSLSFLVLRKRYPDWERPFKVKFGFFIGITSSLFCLWILYVTINEITASSLLALGVYASVGIAFHIYSLFKRRTNPEEWRPNIMKPENIEK